MIERISPAELVAASGDDMYCRVAVHGAAAQARAWAGGGAVAWLRTDTPRPRLSGTGSPAGAAAIVAAVHEELPAGVRMAFPRGWVAYLPASVAVEHPRGWDHADWDWMWTSTAPDRRPGEELARWLGPVDHDRVRALLTEVSPGASTWPGDDRSRRWAGLTTPDGRLAACLADTSLPAPDGGPGVAHISSVATALDRRGRGYGAAVTSWATRRFLDEDMDPVTLGMYADNDVARRMYERLGFTCSHRFTSAVLATQPADAPV